MPATMQKQRRWLAEMDEDAANRQTASLAGIAITLLLLVAGLFLIRVLHTKVAVEDCLMAGRLNCDRLVQTAQVPPRR